MEDFSLPALRASLVLEALETGESSTARLEDLPDAVREAEVVVMFANPLGSIDADTSYNLESCFLATSPGECSPESFTGYTEELKAVWAKIIELRKGKATILRATDIYNPLVKNWQAAGVYESCTTC